MLGTLCLALVLTTSAQAARAMVRLDFDQKYFVHPGHQVWDFRLIKPDSVYHIFYHAIPEATPLATYGDTIWHATTADLKHWDIAGPVVAVGQTEFEQGAVWAPDVVRDEANQRWVMAYTACDPSMNQRLALATSTDLFSWTKVPANPVLEPDTLAYIWNPGSSWSNFRDPFVWRDQGLWHVLLTAKKWYSGGTGILYHATSPDLTTWTDVGPLFINDGPEPWLVLESPQFRMIGDYHHLFCGLFDDSAISLLSAADPALWTMADSTHIEVGSYAPDLTEYAPERYLFGRIVPFILPQSAAYTYVARFDTLNTGPLGENPTIARPHPLDEHWATITGLIFRANPTFGDNPLWRGEPTVGLVGNGYFSSQEYYQGPLSGIGAPGVSLGDGVQGRMDSQAFVIAGNRIDLLVGGGHYPETCTVALLAAADSSVLFRATGDGQELMSPLTWDVSGLSGTSCFIRIVDAETGPMGHINVDEINERRETASSVPPRGQSGPVTRVRASPNPGNPITAVSFALDHPAEVRLRILDLRGRAVWVSPHQHGVQGINRILWNGRDNHGSPASAGAYFFAIEVQGSVAATGKLSLVK